MKPYRLKTFTETVQKRIDVLLHSLDSSAPDVSAERLHELMKDEDFILFVCEDETGEIAGMLTLTRCQTLSRSKYWIEDVIVDNRFRGHGVGRALVRAAVEHVRAKEEFPALYLTSNPSRVSARNLYRSEGFEEYETGVFRLPKA